MPPNSFCVDPPTGVRPVYDGLIIEFPPFQLSTKTPEELLAQPDFAAVWRPGGDITSDHIQEFMSVVTSAHLRADPNCYGDLPSRWHLPSTFVGEQRPLVRSSQRTALLDIDIVLRTLRPQLQSLALSRWRWTGTPFRFVSGAIYTCPISAAVPCIISATSASTTLPSVTKFTGGVMTEGEVG